jgi:hypothetical protein
MARAALIVLVAGLLGIAPGALCAQSIAFGGYNWQVRSGTGGRAEHVCRQQRLARRQWLPASEDCAQPQQMDDRRSVHRCRARLRHVSVQINGRPDHLDDNVVLGLFNYTTPGIGPDGTNEIDIEFATWGGSQPQHGNWTVWPAVQQVGTTATTHSYDTTLTGDMSTHRFAWTPQQCTTNRVWFQ